MKDIPQKIKKIFRDLGDALSEEYPNEWIVLHYHRLPNDQDKIIIASSNMVAIDNTNESSPIGVGH